MAEMMKDRGVIVSGSDVKNKIESLKRKYRQEEEKVGPSGGTPSEWPLYTRVHTIVGGYKSYNLDMVSVDNIEIFKGFIGSNEIRSEASSSQIESGCDSPVFTPSTKMKRYDEDSFNQSMELAERRCLAIEKMADSVAKMVENTLEL